MPIPDRISLDAQARAAAHRDRSKLCQGSQKRRSRASSDYPKYDGQYLSLPHLAYLVAAKLSEWSSWTAWTSSHVESALKVKAKPDRALPVERAERQLFLEALQRVLEDCFIVANEPSIGEPENYLTFLGVEPKAETFREFGFNPSSIGFFRITEWNINRMLDEALNVGLVEEISSPRVQDWVEPDLLQNYLSEEQARRPGSLCPTLVGYQEDNREAQGEKLVIKVARSRYYRHVALVKCLKSNQHLYDRLIEKIGGQGRSTLESIIESAPDSNISLNVTVSAANGKVMLIKRPDNATVWPSHYQAGPHETMLWTAPGQKEKESCFELARRALWEETRIERRDLVGNIVFSWFGYYLREAQGYFFAHAQTRLTENEIVRKAETAESAFEIEDIDWIDLTPGNVLDVLNTWKKGPWEAGQDNAGRTYLPHATISLTQLFRVKRQQMLPHI